MTRTELLLSDSARHLLNNAIEARAEGKRKMMRREAKRMIDWARNYSKPKQQAFFVEDTFRPSTGRRP